MKYFNVTGICDPNEHYMVDIHSKLVEIKKLVDRGNYFTINRARQYGKTTTLNALGEYLKDEYLVISMDFQIEMSDAKFRNENTFSVAFATAFLESLENNVEIISSKMQDALCNLQNKLSMEEEKVDLVELFKLLSKICANSKKPIVLMIDEVDSATNNQVFLDFLVQLRGYYLLRRKKATFQSVILAGVYDIKNMKQKIRPENEHKVNSSWNVATDFLVDMSFSTEDIKGMLVDYENDWHTGMDIALIAKLIYEYTSGYPFLVSRICKLMDERIVGSEGFENRNLTWTKSGFLKAIRMLLEEENTLFESLDNKLIDYPKLKKMLRSLLLQGKRIEYIPGNEGIRMAIMFGFVSVKDGILSIANRIFEIRLYNGFLAEQTLDSEIAQIAVIEKNQFIKNGFLDMELVIRKFVEHYTELFANKDEKFLEDDGRSLFLLYLRPIINGTGNYYVETRTRNNKRTDIIVDYHGKQEVIELKIWHGAEYHSRGEEQLKEYLEYYHLKRGYMISFNFNKNKKVGIYKTFLGDKLLIEAVV